VPWEAQWTREVKSLNPSSFGTGNLALETVPWWETQKKMWFKEFFWETQCLYCVQWENGYGTQAGEHAGARRWTMKLVDSGRVLNEAPQFVGRPEGELQWQADVGRVRPRRSSRFSACQVLWPIGGRFASRAAVGRTSSLMCATHLLLLHLDLDHSRFEIEALLSFQCWPVIDFSLGYNLIINLVINNLLAGSWFFLITN
jgi:hypothetical protein